MHALLDHIQSQVTKNVRQHAGRLAYNSPVYQWSLGGSIPDRLLLSPTDLWQGSADDARWLIYKGAFSLYGDRLELHNADWAPQNVDDQWIRHINGFSWLRDLRALGGDEGRKASRTLISNWIKHFGKWDELTWRADILGARLGHWLAAYDFYGESADNKFQERILECISRQARHLSRTLQGSLHGLDYLYALRGLAYAGLALPDKEGYLEQALNYLDQELDHQILSDGGPISRNPEHLLQVVRILIDIRCAMKQGGYPAVEKIQHTLDRAIPALRFFRHGDGRFGLFNGAQEYDAEELKKTVMHAGSRARTLNSLPHTGYERISMGRSLLLIDAGKPPATPHNDGAHYAPLSFEFSHGRERIFVNCGAHPTSKQWQDALSATPAHNALVIDDRNIYETGQGKIIPSRAKHIVINREDKRDVTLIDACHEGYVPAHGIVHRRRFYLADKGRDLRGEDNLTCAVGLTGQHAVAARFHLHPRVMVSLVQNGEEALLRLGNGLGWRFTIIGGTLALEDSIYLSDGIRPRKTKQLVVRGTMAEDHLQFKWALQKETT